MKKILLALSVVSLMAAVGCNRDNAKEDTNMDMQREETRDLDAGAVEREESIDYEADDRVGRPVDEIEVEEVDRRIED